MINPLVHFDHWWQRRRHHQLIDAIMAEVQKGVGYHEQLWPIGSSAPVILEWCDLQLRSTRKPYGFWAAQVVLTPMEQPCQSVLVSLGCWQRWEQIQPLLNHRLQQWSVCQPVRTVVLALGSALAATFPPEHLS